MNLTSSSFRSQHPQPSSPALGPLSSPTTSTSQASSRPGCGPSIPEECLQQVFSYLTRDLTTLHSLILVSKAFFRIAMPLLYASPFDLLETHECFSSQDRIKRHASLLFLLMNCCSMDLHGQQEQDKNKRENSRPFWADLPPICPSFQEDHEPLKRPLVDYLSAYHHYYLCMNLSSTFPILFPNIQRLSPPSPSSIKSSITNPNPGKRSAQQHQQSKHEPQHSPGNTTMTMFTRNEIERTFLLHRPEVIRTISLPIQRLAALPSIVTSLLNLVRFELYGITWHFNLDPAIEFVQQHTKLHGTIRELKVAGPNDVEARQLKKPKLHGIIQAIKHPRVIDLSRYKEAVRDLNSFQIQNVDRLEQLLFNIEYIPPSRPPPTPKLESSATVLAAPSPQVQNGAPLGQEDHTLDLIRECSSLTTLHIGVQSPTAFSWAVNCYDSNPSSMLLRPKVLHISSAGASTAKRIVEDCVYAFRNSLEDLKGVALSLSRASSSPSIKIASFGWSWPLHQLSVLSLQGELATWFDLESLRFCPKLTEFKLRLQPNPPAKADFLEKVFLAPHLKVFSLTGLWIVTDSVMDSLGDGLAKLQSLVIIGCDCQSVTGDGLKRALSKMKTLERAQLDLGEKMEVVLERYRGERPGLEIRGATHDILGRRD